MQYKSFLISVKIPARYKQKIQSVTQLYEINQSEFIRKAIVYCLHHIEACLKETEEVE